MTAASVLGVLYVIWGAGSLTAVVGSFICWCGWPGELGRGICVLIFLLSLGSLIGAIAVNPG